MDFYFLSCAAYLYYPKIGKRYAYKFDFAGLAAATQPQATDASYKYQSDFLMSPYHGAKLSSFMSPHHSMTSSSGKLIMTKIIIKTQPGYFPFPFLFLSTFTALSIPTANKHFKLPSIISFGKKPIRQFLVVLCFLVAFTLPF